MIVYTEITDDRNKLRKIKGVLMIIEASPEVLSQGFFYISFVL